MNRSGSGLSRTKWLMGVSERHCTSATRNVIAVCRQCFNGCTSGTRLLLRAKGIGAMDMETVSADIADWSREAVGLLEFAPGRKLIRAIRDWQRHSTRKDPVSRLRAWLAGKRHQFWSVIAGADIPLVTRIGGGLLIPHPNGIVIHPDSVIGVNCLLFQQVTLGATSSATPVLEGHVDVGAGAKILGPVTVGRHARVGANAVVVKDVPPGITVVGIPARPL